MILDLAMVAMGWKRRASFQTSCKWAETGQGGSPLVDQEVAFRGGMWRCVGRAVTCLPRIGKAMTGGVRRGIALLRVWPQHLATDRVTYM